LRFDSFAIRPSKRQPIPKVLYRLEEYSGF